MRRFLQTCETLLALTAAWMLVFVLPFRLLVRLLARGASRAGMPSDLVVGRGLARRVMRLAPRMPFRTTCLVRAVAGWVMLRWRGVPAVVRFGVRCPAGVRRTGGLRCWPAFRTRAARPMSPSVSRRCRRKRGGPAGISASSGRSGSTLPFPTWCACASRAGAR
ncbi:MAG: hypothetical protein B7Y84_16075 [Azorhizobium sp. 32-67-21]|nr:MAG: hypothetical protein B7Y84_16075 [Azorhizobium sp. 32-67-21]